MAERRNPVLEVRIVDHSELICLKNNTLTVLIAEKLVKIKG